MVARMWNNQIKKAARTGPKVKKKLLTAPYALRSNFMKFSFYQAGQLSLLLLAFFILTTSCNKEDFFKAEEFLFGEDAYCNEAAPSLESCLQLADRCQPAYLDSEDESSEPTFFACLANPNYQPPSDGSTTGGSSDGSSSSSSSDDSSSTGGSDDSTSSTSSDSSSSTGGSDNDSSSSSSDSTSSTGGSDDGPVVIVPPNIEETVATKCENLDPKYLWTKKIIQGNKESKVSRVKVCHQTSNNDAHTILIACPALKAHIKHHDDYIGACN